VYEENRGKPVTKQNPTPWTEHIGVIDDMHLEQSHVIATYAFFGNEPALVDPGPASTIAHLEAGLAAHGLAFGDIRHILLTHIHLDHAGATGTLVARYPHLRVYVHERGAPHMIAPDRLIRSATRLYGAEMERFWGEIRPVPEQAITTLVGGETLRLGERSLAVYDAPGHAPHHVIYFDEASGAACVGDNTGVRLPGFARARPATPPPDVDIEAWLRTLDMLSGLEPRLLLLTHFGPIEDVAEHIADYRETLVRWAEFVREGMASGADEATQIARLQALADAELHIETEADFARYKDASPVDLNWHGLARYWRQRAAER
jgi:glyoxylase-like metal-dependent hydrolase (beta-lactamase superfamily II)